MANSKTANLEFSLIYTLFHTTLAVEMKSYGLSICSAKKFHSSYKLLTELSIQCMAMFDIMIKKTSVFLNFEKYNIFQYPSLTGGISPI